jgi:hypothetical protein
VYTKEWVWNDMMTNYIAKDWYCSQWWKQKNKHSNEMTTFTGGLSHLPHLSNRWLYLWNLAVPLPKHSAISYFGIINFSAQLFSITNLNNREWKQSAYLSEIMWIWDTKMGLGPARCSQNGRYEVARLVSTIAI